MKCNDCKNIFNEGGIIEAGSLRYGRYYKGPAICEKCKNIRYEKHIRKVESEGEPSGKQTDIRDGKGGVEMIKRREK